jgi:predicted HNH restriction endonuclease
LCRSAKNLSVHHITYENIGFEKMDDLISVCKECHKKLHEHDSVRPEGIRPEKWAENETEAVTE